MAKQSHGVTVRHNGECLSSISESLRHKQGRRHLYYSGCGFGGGLIMSPKSEPGPGMPSVLAALRELPDFLCSLGLR